MNGSYNVAEKVLDYWFTIEFLAQDKFSVQALFEKNANLTEDEKVIYKLLSKTMLKPISEIAPYVSFGKSKTTQLLKDMGHKGVVAVEGKGRGTKYIIK